MRKSQTNSGFHGPERGIRASTAAAATVVAEEDETNAEALSAAVI